jgi:Cu-Zn family superoxide dismutase
MIERVLTDRLGGADRPAVFPGPLLLAVVALSACGGASAGEAGGMTATAEIRSCSDSEITGTATFRERPSSEGVKLVDISLEVRGLTDGSHAVHVHETGSCEPCGSAGGHHDPGAFGKTTPDAPDYNHPFHGGDLVNLVVAEGVGTRTMTSSRFTLSPGRMSLFDEDGSALIIHTNTDTYCDQAGELEAGCAGGARDACGVLVPGESGAD